MNIKINILICFLILIFSDVLLGQGWQQINPPEFNQIENYRCFNYQNGEFEIFVWNYNKGYRIDENLKWDSTLVYYSYLCNPIYSIYSQLRLVEIAKSYQNSEPSFRVYLRSGCMVECATEVFFDTIGQNTLQNSLHSFDDFLCLGVNSKIKISKLNENNIYFIYYDELYYSTDRGQNFTVISTPDSNEYSPLLTNLFIHPKLENILFTTGFESTRQSGYLYKSSDEGYSWKSVLDVEIKQIEFHPSKDSIIFAVSDSGIYKSTDFGSSWIKKQVGQFLSIEIDEKKPDNLFAGSRNGELFVSTDAGEEWHIFNNTFTTSEIIGIYKRDNNDSLIVVSKEGVFKVYNPYILGVDNYVTNQTGRFLLYQNYPNPFNPITNIGFRIPESGLLTLKVYDILGKEVATLINEEKSAGNYEVEFDASSLPSGVYFYQLEAGGFVKTNKMILLR